MTKEKICLASDNCSSVHPTVFKTVMEANSGYALSYGADGWTALAQECIHQAFQSQPKVLIVPTGTGANVLALKLSCRPHESVICTDIAHIHYQESGAAEAVVGCKLLTVPHKKGKITTEEIIRKLHSERAFGKHSTSPRLLCITQPTEVGTVYTLEELKSLAALCKQENLLFHIDGSRLYNAAVSLNTSLAAMMEGISVDMLSLGGTKNGLMCAESLLVFNPKLQEGADHLHKQTFGLVSKMRYFSAQYVALFNNDLWRALATEANKQAHAIAAIIASIPPLRLSYPVETNQIFFTAPLEWIPVIQDKILCYPWNKEKNELRFIASWETTEQDVEGVRAVLQELLRRY